MKFSNIGRIGLALVASFILTFGTESCYNYTEAYIIVTGSQYNQVASYKEDNDTGQLTAATPPVSSGGANPIRAILLTGGRYVYVLNQGTQTVDSSGNITWKGGNVSLFSVGGNGTLSFQKSYTLQGLDPQRLALSASGSYLYVLDRYQPGLTTGVTTASASQSPTSPCYSTTNSVYYPAGAIEAYSIDASTGRLFLVQNLQQENSLGTPLSYFPVGCGAIDFYLAANFLYTAEASDPASGNAQVVYAYGANPSSGQLTQVPGGAQPIIGATNISVIGASSGGAWIYVLDAGTNTIFIFSAGSNGLLNAAAIPSEPNDANFAGMDALTTDSQSKYLYVANTLSPSLGQPGSALSVFTITSSSGALTPATPPYYPTGSGPVCVFEDPSKQYVYTADANSSTMVGAAFDANTGTLTPLPRGSTFPVVGTPTWCLYSSNTD